MMTWQERLRARKARGEDMSLTSLLAMAKTHRMTPEEKEAQRKGWVIGELMLKDFTREDAERLYNNAVKELSDELNSSSRNTGGDDRG